MAVTRTHFTFRIDLWTPNGESIVEQDYALATYRTAVERWLGGAITQSSRSAWLGLRRLVGCR
jgi:hypothetical protein